MADQSEICEYATIAREAAVLGNYDHASVYYESVLQKIHQMMQINVDKKIKWNEVC